MPPKIIVYGQDDLINALFKSGNLTSNSIPKILNSETLQDSISLREESDGTIKIGTTTNYIKITPNGHITFEGSASVFDDLLGDVTKLKVVGTGISENTTENSVGFGVLANLSDYLYVNYQIMHCWKLGSVLFPHLHFEQTTINVPNFLIQYRWQTNGLSKVTNWTNYICNTPVFTYTSGTLNQIVTGSGITPPSNYGLSDILQIRIIRDNANTSTLFTGVDLVNETVYLTSGDIHIEKNDNGSNTEYNKL